MEIHDYDLYDLDFEEWCRRGREAFGLPHPPEKETTQNIIQDLK